jgi:hypothetical protein
MSLNEKIYEGGYTYFRDGQKYSEETFDVFKDDSVHQFHTFSSQVITRVKTGELLKVNVDYQCNKHFEPIQVRIKKSMGNNYVTERYNFDVKEKLLRYNFESETQNESYEKVIQGRFAIATPAFLTNMLMLETKKLDPINKTEYLIVTANNTWQYEGPFVEQRLYAELKDREAELKINKTDLKSTLIHVYDEAQVNANAHAGIEYYISNHISLPYQANFGELIVQINHLKDLGSHYQKIF